MRKIILIFCVMIVSSSCLKDKTTKFSLRFTDEILLPYTPIQNQGKTQTCWAYTMASLMESDYLSKQKDTIHLSVMYAVRQKYMRQFEQFYYSKGKEEIRGGGLGHSFLYVLKEKGAIPIEVYKGHSDQTSIHDHRNLLRSLKRLAEKAVREKDLFTFKKKAEAILDDCLGKVPERFLYRGKEYTARTFANSFFLNEEHYIELTSFTHHPFYSWFVLEVPDNWEHASFFNVPIDTMETCVNRSLHNGQTVAWDGDISEDGFLARYGVALYPDSVVSQYKRQEYFDKFETTDDHMMHIVGSAYDELGNFYYILRSCLKIIQ